MSHNIATSGQASGVRTADRVPTVGPLWENPVLTIGDVSRGNQVTLLFHGGTKDRFSSNTTRIVVNPWNADGPGKPVDIVGEDLFALRELLAELPEEAFVRPADPVKVPTQTWTPGDVVIFDGGTLVITYTRLANGCWQRVSAASGSIADDSYDYDDVYIEGQLARPRYSVLRQAVQ